MKTRRHRSLQQDVPTKRTKKNQSYLPQLTIEERLQSKNGKVVDPDSLITIFSNDLFTAGEIASLRQTCLWWSRVLCSNALWRYLYYRDFYPLDDTWESLSRKANEKQVDRFWYNEYMDVLNQIPRLERLPQRLQDLCWEEPNYSSEEEDEEEPEEETDEGEKSCYYSYLTLNLPKGTTATYQLHKLALILAVLGENKYFPKTHSKHTEFVKIGLEKHRLHKVKERTKLIPLLRFCYAVLRGKEDQLFTEEDSAGAVPESYSEPSDDLDNYPGMYEAISEIPKYDSREFNWDKEDDFKSAPTIGISPNIEGPFKSFVYYLRVAGCKDKRKNTYKWMTDEDGWAPGYFNAGFAWFQYLTMYSTYDPKDNSITIEKLIVTQ